MLKVSDFEHIPVLLAPALECLAIRPDGVYVDCTLGGGGHSAAILERLGPNGRLIALDQDQAALQAGRDKLAHTGGPASWQTFQENFANLGSLLDRLGLAKVDGILADLGVSSWQLDQAERGFSYGQDGPLDMRMNPETGPTAADVVNSYSEYEIARILRDFGEERYAGKISRAIVEYRCHQPFRTTSELAALVRGAMPGQGRQEAQHPARRTFQALRIEVNQELAALEELLAEAPHRLNAGGRLCIITFHSLEDRRVKEAFKKLENPCTCPRDFPICVCGKKPLGRAIPAKAIIAAAEEQAGNPRSRSAKLRCFEYWEPQQEVS
jgi:16S rRNA (cytosine1402-N4)-methyltransferase